MEGVCDAKDLQGICTNDTDREPHQQELHRRALLDVVLHQADDIRHPRLPQDSDVRFASVACFWIVQSVVFWTAYN